VKPRFVVYCLELYRQAEGLDGAETADIFERLGLIDYLCAGYDVLHSLGEAALIEDIRDYVTRRKKLTASCRPLAGIKLCSFYSAHAHFLIYQKCVRVDH